MKNLIKLLAIAVIAFLVWGGFKIYESEESARELKTYSSKELSFQYPAKYFLEEKIVNEAQRFHKRIILTEDTEENRLVREGKTPPREGPVAITVDVFQNNLDKMTLMQFVTGTNDSNYKLGAGKVSTTTIGSLEGLEYFWSGLYEGRSFVLSSKDFIYHFAATFMNYNDAILHDFETIIGTVNLN
jgi:hypothetical protein